MSQMKEVLVVTVGAPINSPVKTSEVFSTQALRELREYIVESIQKEVLVLDVRMALQVKQLPCVNLPDVWVQTQPETLEPIKEDPTPKKLTPREEKQQILEQLKKYREKHGLGSLDLVAMKVKRKGLTGDILRMVLRGDAKLELTDWRAVGKALDELKEEGGADG